MKVAIGEWCEVSRVISEEQVQIFAELSGDKNPIHIDPFEAEKSVFGKRIVHGFLVGSIFSMILGTIFPGPGTIYLEQNMKFLSPVFIDEVIFARVEVIEIVNLTKNIVKLKTEIVNQQHTLVVDGYAIVKLPA